MSDGSGRFSIWSSNWARTLLGRSPCAAGGLTQPGSDDALVPFPDSSPFENQDQPRRGWELHHDASKMSLTSRLDKGAFESPASGRRARRSPRAGAKPVGLDGLDRRASQQLTIGLRGVKVDGTVFPYRERRRGVRVSDTPNETFGARRGGRVGDVPRCLRYVRQRRGRWNRRGHHGSHDGRGTVELGVSVGRVCRNADG